MPVIFPNIRPTSREYTPGKYPQTFFESINGATSIVQFGAVKYNAQLQLLFSNIEDTWADDIISKYESSNISWDNIVFQSGVMDCVGASMAARMKEGFLKWRFAEPPSVTYKFRDYCDVRCSFIAYLDGT